MLDALDAPLSLAKLPLDDPLPIPRMFSRSESDAFWRIFNELLLSSLVMQAPCTDPSRDCAPFKLDRLECDPRLPRRNEGGLLDSNEGLRELEEPFFPRPAID